jgi:CRP-like cAMP-binding protein
MSLDIAFQNFARLIDLTKAEKKIFASLAQVVELKRWDMLLAEGQICKYEYFILSGCLRSFYIDANLKEHTTMFALEGWWTGDLRSFHKNIPSNVAIEALEKSVVLRLSKTQLEELYHKVAKFERYFRILLQNRLLANEDRLANHLSAKASQSYEEFCSRYPNIEQRISQKYIASYLGITATYLSRLRKNKPKK